MPSMHMQSHRLDWQQLFTECEYEKDVVREILDFVAQYSSAITWSEPDGVN